MSYRAKRALYSTTDPNGPEAANGHVTTEAPQSGFQICSDGGVLSDALVAKLGLEKCGLVVGCSRQQALAENDARNLATYRENASTGRVVEIVPKSKR